MRDPDRVELWAPFWRDLDPGSLGAAASALHRRHGSGAAARRRPADRSRHHRTRRWPHDLPRMIEIGCRLRDGCGADVLIMGCAAGPATAPISKRPSRSRSSSRPRPPSRWQSAASATAGDKLALAVTFEVSCRQFAPPATTASGFGDPCSSRVRSVVGGVGGTCYFSSNSSLYSGRPSTIKLNLIGLACRSSTGISFFG